MAVAHPFLPGPWCHHATVRVLLREGAASHQVSSGWGCSAPGPGAVLAAGPRRDVPPAMSIFCSLGGRGARRHRCHGVSCQSHPMLISQQTPHHCNNPRNTTAVPAAARPACMCRICQKLVFSQGSVRVRGRVTLVRRSLVSIKRSSGATPGVRSTGCPSGLSTPFLTLNLPWLFFYGGISARCQALPRPPQGCPRWLSPRRGTAGMPVRLRPPLAPGSRVNVHGHCSQPGLPPPTFAEGEDEDGSPE